MKAFPKYLFLLCLPLLCLPSPIRAGERVRFVVYSDLHQDLIPDAPERLQTIIDAARKAHAGFMINLGDLAFPIAENRIITDLLDSSGIRQYHALGNHDMDRSDKQTYLDFTGLENPYYTFDSGIFRFVVLDTNFFTDRQGNEIPYANGNYFSGATERDIVNREQLEWLDRQLTDRSKIYVLFMHAPDTGIDPVLEAARQRGICVAAVFSGHLHSDNYELRGGIHRIHINSASYLWGGEAFYSKDRYPDSVYRRYSQLPYMAPYRIPLYAIVEISASGKIRIQGIRGEWLSPAPRPEQLDTKPYPTSPSVSDRKLRFRRSL